MKKWILMAALVLAAGTGSVLEVQAASDPMPDSLEDPEQTTGEEATDEVTSQPEAEESSSETLPGPDDGDKEPDGEMETQPQDTPEEGVDFSSGLSSDSAVEESESASPANTQILETYLSAGSNSSAAAEEKKILTGGSLAQAQDTNVDYVLVNASTGASGKNSSFNDSVSSVQSAGKLVGFVHQGQGGTAGTAYEEATNFYNAIKEKIGQGILVLDCIKLDPSSGTVWVRDFLDFMVSFSGVRPLVNGTSASQWQSYDWSGIETNKLSGTAFNGTVSQFKEAGQVKETDPCYKELMYRMYNPNSGEHFYTRNKDEKNYLSSVGWNYEGVSWMAKEKTAVEVYRLYNPNAGDHHYTTSKDEKNYLVRVGWNYEGVGWYAQSDKTSAVWRAYNPNAISGTHHFTMDENEYKYILSVGWKGEGIAWYGIVPVNNLKAGNYILNNTNGYSQTGAPLSGVQKVGSSLYYFNSSGVMSKGTGCTKIGDKKWIWVNTDGTLAAGEKQSGNDIKYFDKTTGLALLSQFVKIGDRICYFNGEGNRCSGSLTLGNAKFELDASNGNILKTVINGVQYLNQTDSRWAMQTFGYFTFRSTGCVPTVLTMIINALTGSNLTPADVGKKLYEAGVYNVGYEVGTGGNGIVAAGRIFNLAVEAVTSVQQLTDSLRTGGMIAAAMNPGDFCPAGITHEILAYGYQNGTVNVLDPYWSEHNGTASAQTIWNQKSTGEEDNWNGGPIFCFKKK